MDLLQPRAFNIIITSWQKAVLCMLHLNTCLFFPHLGMRIIFIFVKPHLSWTHSFVYLDLESSLFSILIVYTRKWKKKNSSQGCAFHSLAPPDRGNRGVTSRNHIPSCLLPAVKLHHPGEHRITGRYYKYHVAEEQSSLGLKCALLLLLFLELYSAQ